MCRIIAADHSLASRSSLWLRDGRQIFDLKGVACFFGRSADLLDEAGGTAAVLLREK